MSPSIANRVAGWSEPRLHAASGRRPAFTAERTTQSIPKRKRSSASLSSVQTQTLFGFAPSSVTALIACGSEFQGVVGGPPRRNTQTPHSRKSSEMSRSIASWVSEIPEAAPGGDKLAAVDVARDGKAAAERRGEDRVAPAVAQRHLHKVHLLPEAHGLGPSVEDAPDLGRRQVAAGGLEPAGRSRGPCSAR